MLALSYPCKRREPVRLPRNGFAKPVTKWRLAFERIVNAEAEASGAPRQPEITPLDRYSLNLNDEAASHRIAEAFRAHFSPTRVRHTGPAPASVAALA
jgi:hypothetical protein